MAVNPDIREYGCYGASCSNDEGKQKRLTVIALG